MSFVSGVMLMMSLSEQDEEGVTPSIVRALDRWLGERGFAALADLTDGASGNKHPQVLLYGAGYNYFPEDEFVVAAMGCAWAAPECVVLAIQPESGPTRVWRPRA